MLEKTVECMKNIKKRKEEMDNLTIKTEDDFVKEVVEIKYTNVILSNQLEIAEREKKILKEIIQYLREKNINYVVKIPEIKEKIENEKKQELIQEACG